MNNFCKIVCAALVGVISVSVTAKPETQKGVIRCGGNYFERMVGTPNHELHYVNYVFRNRSSKGAITIDRLTFYDAKGVVVYDSTVDGFPAFSNGTLSEGSRALQPNQTGQLDVSAFFTESLAITQRPMQLEVVWSASKNAAPLSMDLIRLVNRMDPVTRAKGSEITRDSQDCDSFDANGRLLK